MTERKLVVARPMSYRDLVDTIGIDTYIPKDPVRDSLEEWNAKHGVDLGLERTLLGLEENDNY